MLFFPTDAFNRMMRRNEIVDATLAVSSVFQAITLGVAVLALVLAYRQDDGCSTATALRQPIVLETAINAIELVVYLALVRRSESFQRMTNVRYVDWVVTTPIMLLTAALYMRYRHVKENVDEGWCGEISVLDFIGEERAPLAVMLAANGGMLAAGYLAEIGAVPRVAGLVAGFLAMTVAFRVLWTRYACSTRIGRNIFAYMVVTWSLYGAAFMADDITKNVSYNVLDTVAKNFFVLFLAWQSRA